MSQALCEDLGRQSWRPFLVGPPSIHPLSVQHLLICVLPQRMEMGQTCWTQIISIKGLWDCERCRNTEMGCAGEGDSFQGPPFIS